MKNMRLYGTEKKITAEDLLKALEATPEGLGEKEVKRIVNDLVKKKKLVSKLGLTDWDILIDFGPCEQPQWAAQCAQDPAYKIAHIRIDPALHDKEQDVKESLLHELMHVIVSPVESFFMVQLAGLDDESPEAGRQMEHWRQSNEQLVCKLTKLYTPLLG